jgi:DNA polymerase-3 subunit epsilon
MDFGFEPDHTGAHNDAIIWARQQLARNDWVILDTETTGIEGAIEILQLGVLAPSGRVLLDALVRPQNPIPAAATRIHGITDADVQEALPFPYIYAMLERIVYPNFTGKQVVIYNSTYDTNVLLQACTHYDLPLLPFLHTTQFYTDIVHHHHVCAMRQYAAFYGEWNEHHGNYRFQKLPGGTHQAIDDCRQVLALIKTMAAAPLLGSEEERITRAAAQETAQSAE